MLTTLVLLLLGLMVVLVRKGDAASKVMFKLHCDWDVALFLKCWCTCSHFQTARLRARRLAFRLAKRTRRLARRLAKRTRSKRGASRTDFVLPEAPALLLAWACASTLMLATALDMDLLRIAAVDFCVFAHLVVRLSICVSMSQVHFLLNSMTVGIIDVGQQALCRRGRSVQQLASCQGNAHQGGLGAEIANQAWKVGYIKI